MGARGRATHGVPHGALSGRARIFTTPVMSLFDPFSDDSSAADVPRLEVVLRIRGSALDPDFLTQQLGVQPTTSARQGDRWDDPDPLDEERVRPSRGRNSGEWSYRLAVPPDTELGDVLGLLLGAFPEDAVLWEEITSTYMAEVCCGVYLQGDTQRTTIDTEVLGALAKRRLSLRFDFHVPFG